ncbi:helix-turn-helix domain-containing protein [Kingella oralis]|uniref:Transcriptional regulator, HxlR family n=1 Tax=Kingella oralis ATCC 51147 TaxID=629741 RepID=C4GF10_9NEIS|nr:helix-turn-helix domain-containing protein [Kingella oralis]EEP68815.1 transcriptional regulator, HxlR family [Kingella oralis ATCC 51147]QMT41980.1 helix-turn-helix transcriptional regulator [Kingella oralis]RKW33132.1 MAG: transcriptional regulator [Kingella sp. (in: b-proteobacteria)]
MLSAIELTMKLVGGKWKCLILYHLGGGARRTRDLLERLGGISPKVLTEQLRQLEADGLVAREVFAEVPPRVEYRLSEEGKTFLPALYTLCDWGKAYGLRHGTATSPCPPPAE